LWCACLPWSRLRVVIPVLDKTLPTIAAWSGAANTVKIAKADLVPTSANLLDQY
jgi:hypothetical protein